MGLGPWPVQSASVSQVVSASSRTFEGEEKVL